MLKKSLLVILMCCAIYFSASAIWSSYLWYQMSHKTLAKIISWRVVELSESQFAIEADYLFEHAQNVAQGTTRFAKPYFLNRFSAEGEIKRMEKCSWQAYYDNGNLKRSSLQRYFPLKKNLHAFLVIAVGLYFLCLDRIFIDKRVQKA